jgi:hypothetical protein
VADPRRAGAWAVVMRLRHGEGHLTRLGPGEGDPHPARIWGGSPWVVAVGGPAAVAVPAGFLRFGAADPVMPAAFAFSGLLVSLAVTLGSTCGRVDRHHARSVAGAGRAQRLHLARDLHVANDVGAMPARAQAGRQLAGRDPRHAGPLCTTTGT